MKNQNMTKQIDHNEWIIKVDEQKAILNQQEKHLSKVTNLYE